jgi:murein DD-endopeptidase MepM/ murein hydrolase activator NlpD
MPRLAQTGVRFAVAGRARLGVLLAAAIAVGTTPFSSPQAAPQRRASEFWLDNGMQVVVIPDTRAPVVTHVVWYRVGGADNVPGQLDPKQPAGNHVILDFGNSEYGLLAHFKKGSVRVKTGQSVAAGDTLALCGNSGNSSQPHLHFHLQNGPVLFGADGLPAPFTDYLAHGKPVDRGEPVRGDIIERKP